MKGFETGKLVYGMISQFTLNKNIEFSYQENLLTAKTLAAQFVQVQMCKDEPYKVTLNVKDVPVIHDHKNGSDALDALAAALQKSIITNPELLKRIREVCDDPKIRNQNAKIGFLNNMFKSLASASIVALLGCFAVSAIKTFMMPSSLSHFSISNPLIILSGGLAVVKLCSACNIPFYESRENIDTQGLAVELNARIHEVLTTTFAQTALAKDILSKQNGAIQVL
jgi:hypothetical protein